jgi:hypothetical protein
MSTIDLQLSNISKRRGRPTNGRIKSAIDKFVDSFKRRRIERMEIAQN